MNCSCKLLSKCSMRGGRFLSRTVQFCTLGLLLFIAANVPRAQSAPPAQPSETNPGRPAAQIRAILQAQQEAWNRGDIDAFMNGYARSNSIVFLSDDVVTRGWHSARERYKIKYRSRAKMGKLRFSDLEIQPLNDDAAVVLGRWALKRVNGIVQGHFTLVFRRMPEGWRIVHDHTSTAAAQ